MATSPLFSCTDKKHWWLTNRKRLNGSTIILGRLINSLIKNSQIVDKYVKEARVLISSRDHGDIATALGLAEAALAVAPRFETALELKARSLLYLRRYKEVADMLQDYIPSLKMADHEQSSASCLSSDSSKEKVKLLGDSPESESESFKCFSVSDLKKKVMAGLWKSCEKEGQWRYLVLGQACCHLGLMEDSMLLLQTGKRLANAAFRLESINWTDDSFSFSEESTINPPSPPPKTEFEHITQLLCHVKLLLRRKTAALAALDANLYSESIRHFTKILEGRHPAPRAFLAECYMHRAIAYKSLGRIAESIADCNRTLALQPSCIKALATRASIFETIRCLSDSLHDLEHLKLLYNTILRDRKLPGPAWKKHNVRYQEIPGKLSALGLKIQELKQRVGSGESGNVDHYVLIGLRRGCSKPELESAHLLLILRHKPDKSTSFIEKCEFEDDVDVDSVRDSAKMSSLLLYRLIQKGYSSLTRNIVEEQAAETLRNKAAAALQVAIAQAQQQSREEQIKFEIENERMENKVNNNNTNSGSVFQGVFCRDIAVVGSLLFQVGYNRPIPVKYEALSC